MRERWREPLNCLDIQNSDQMTITPTGRVMRNPSFTFDADSIERLRLGYACIKCLEVFEVPWPERCPTCGAPIRKEQAAYFEREFVGDVHLGPTTSLDEERERLREYKEES
jgi:hypothetical protein